MPYDPQYLPSAPIYPQVGNQEEQPQAQRKPATLNTNEVCVKVGNHLKGFVIRCVLGCMLYHKMADVLSFRCTNNQCTSSWHMMNTLTGLWGTIAKVVIALGSYKLASYGIQAIEH